MTNNSAPQAGSRLQERAFWAQGIGKTLASYGKGIDDLPEDLREHCRPNDLSMAQISQHDMNRLWDQAAQLSGDECFGLRMGRQFTSNTLKVLGLAASSSETISDAIQRIVRFFPVFSTQVQMYTVEDEQALTLIFQPRGTPHPMHMEALLVQCGKIWRTLQPEGSTLVLETRLTEDHERYRSCCEEILGTRIRMNSKRLAFRLNRALLRQPLPSADAFLLKRLDASLEDMLEELPNSDFAEQVKQRIRSLVSTREISEELVATPFNMSARHLRRKLSEVNTSYEKLLDEVRMEMAVRLIREGRLNLGRIAFELGFLDPSSFTRAFRRWTGMSPTSYRETAQANG